VLDNLAPSCQPNAARSGLQPVPDLSNCLFRITLVGTDVLTGYVRDEFSVICTAQYPELKYISDSDSWSIAPAAEEQSEFERHIKAR
jgi:hypothetical protein